MAIHRNPSKIIKFTTSDGNTYNKKTIANRHQRYLDAQAILRDSPDMFGEDGDTPIIETYMDMVNQLGGPEKLANILKDLALGPQLQ